MELLSKNENSKIDTDETLICKSIDTGAVTVFENSSAAYPKTTITPVDTDVIIEGSSNGAVRIESGDEIITHAPESDRLLISEDTFN